MVVVGVRTTGDWGWAATLVLACVLILAGCVEMWGGTRPVPRALGGLGHVDLPRRLATASHHELPHYAAYRFQRLAPWWTIGSHTAYRELLVLTVTAPQATSTEAEEAAADARTTVLRHVRDVRWTRQGATLVGEGIDSVNMVREPCWLVIRTLPGHGVLAYRAWKKDIQRPAALAVLDVAEHGLRSLKSREAWFQVIRERPARLRQENREVIRTVRAKLGGAIPDTGGFQEQAGVLYEYAIDSDAGEALFLVRFIGTLPSIRHDRVFHTIEGPEVSWSRWENGRLRHATPLPPGIHQRFEREFTDPQQVYVYALRRLDVVDEQAIRPESIDWFVEKSQCMPDLHRQGKLLSHLN